jgi:phosphoketolase
MTKRVLHPTAESLSYAHAHGTDKPAITNWVWPL